MKTLQNQILNEATLSDMYVKAVNTMTAEDIINLVSEVNYLRKQMKTQLEVISRLKQEAMEDPLTGLPNRRFFERELDRALSAFRRYKRRGAVMLVDANSFKAINDTYGHMAGDAILRHIAQIVTANVRNTDIVTRIGGDEFCIILTDVSADEAYIKADQLAELVATTPCEFDGQTIQASISVGVASFADAGSKKELLELADSAMYADKAAHKAAVGE
jgi:diguanylate cyclase (GGDEF)-like protein